MRSSSNTHLASRGARLLSFFPNVPSALFKVLSFLALFLVLAFLHGLISQISTQTKTIAGHNLIPTPWHHFPPKSFPEEDNKYSKASKLIKCSFLPCLSPQQNHHHHHNQQKIKTSNRSSCPSFFQYIHEDLKPWKDTRISETHINEAKKLAAFRVVIVQGRLYVEYYYDCFQTRMMFTIWGLLQMLKRYEGIVPDVDLMFDCTDKPFVSRGKYREGTKAWPPPVLLRYCTTQAHFDIPFPDWSFWGWAETNIEPWDEQFRSIKQGSQTQSWANKWSHAYWKGNPDVGSAVRKKLLRCNNTNRWGAEIMRQDWLKEERGGYKQSKLANQCKHRFLHSWTHSKGKLLACLSYK